MADDTVTPVTNTPTQNAFRTYAKDAASLGGKVSAPATPAVQKPQPAPTPITPSEPVSQTTAPQQPPTIEPNLPPAHIIPKAPSTDETRESVLARLRNKVGIQTPQATTAPKPKDKDREAVLARLQSKAQERPVSTPTPQEQAPAPIHTYKTDFADRTKNTGASRISIVAREQDAGTQPQTLKIKSNNRFVFLGGFALIILGAGSIALAYALVTGKPVIPSSYSVPSLILPNERVEIRGSDAELRSALVALEEQTAEGEVTVAYLTFASTTPEGNILNIPAEGGALIAALSLPAPDIVLRNISPESTVGVVHVGEESRPFFILRVDSYERTFAGMLTWEATLARDLAFFYPTPKQTFPTLSADTATSTTASTTPPESFAPYVPRFVDKVVDNYDIRVLYGPYGESVMLYGYKDKTTLIIVRNEDAFREIIKRLASSRTQ